MTQENKKKDNAIGNRIKAARKKLEWTQKMLASKSGINEVQLRGYENGNRTPKKDTLEKIAAATGIPSKWFLYGDPDEVSFLDVFSGKTDFDIVKLVNIARGNSNETASNETEQGFLDLMKKINDERQAESEEKLILDQYNKLNSAGKQKAVEYTTDLAQMPKYQRDPDTKK